jgi:hypothetical protein
VESFCNVNLCSNYPIAGPTPGTQSCYSQSFILYTYARSMILAACCCKELNLRHNVDLSSAPLHQTRTLIKAKWALYCTIMSPLFASLLPNFKCYHNICSHSHLPPNLVVLPHLGQVDGGWRFSSSSNMSCQPSFWSSCYEQSVQLPSAFNEFNPIACSPVLLSLDIMCHEAILNQHCKIFF